MFDQDTNSHNVRSMLRTQHGHPGNALAKHYRIRSGYRAAGRRRLGKASWPEGTSPSEGAQDTEFQWALRVTTHKPVVSGAHGGTPE